MLCSSFYFPVREKLKRARVSPTFRFRFDPDLVSLSKIARGKDAQTSSLFFAYFVLVVAKQTRRVTKKGCESDFEAYSSATK